MKTIKTVEITPVFLDGFMPEEMEENKVYISFQYGCAIHLCLCGCGNKSVTPIPDEGKEPNPELAKHQWILTEKNGKITLSPSILNYNCPNKSHYIITKNKANFV